MNIYVVTAGGYEGERPRVRAKD